MMSNGNSDNGNSAVRLGASKRGLADRYVVGLRTIENWMAGQIIAGCMVGSRVIFDVQECDHRLFAHIGSCQPENEIPSRLAERKETWFAGKVALTRRYGVCKRTIDQWMAKRRLIYFKAKHVVRFDVPACDESLRKYRMIPASALTGPEFDSGGCRENDPQ